MTPKEKVIEGLMEMKIIFPGFAGKVVLHIDEELNIFDAERHEESILRRMKRKKNLDIAFKVA